MGAADDCGGGGGSDCRRLASPTDHGDYAFWVGAISVLLILRGIGEWLADPTHGDTGVARRLRWEASFIGLASVALAGGGVAVLAGWIAVSSGHHILTSLVAFAGAAAGSYTSIKAWRYLGRIQRD
jgi:hypothetical protein